MARLPRPDPASWGALVWVGLAWLGGPLPGQGATGLWWWHLVAVVLVALAATDRLRGDPVPAGAVGGDWWRPGRRWWTVVVVGWVALALLAGVQAVRGVATVGQVVTFAAAAVVAALGPRRTTGAESVGRMGVGGVVLALLTVVVAVDALGQAGTDPFAFYRVKQLVELPVAAHNVLASMLLVGAAAVAVASLRLPWLRWLLPLVGVALGATLSRGALVAGGVAVVVAVAVARDRSTGVRLGVVVLCGSLVVTAALTAFGGAPVPDPGGASSVVSRLELWDAAIEGLVDEPVLGVGLGRFAQHAADSRVEAPHPHAHSLLLHPAATLGVPGLLAVLAVWGGLAVGAYGQLDRDRRTLVLVGLAGLAAHAMIDETVFLPSTEGVLAMLVIVVAAPRERLGQR